MGSYVIVGDHIDPTDDALLFWSNDDGWGALATATVFTQDEKDNGDLPLGGRWALGAS